MFRTPFDLCYKVQNLVPFCFCYASDSPGGVVLPLVKAQKSHFLEACEHILDSSILNRVQLSWCMWVQAVRKLLDSEFPRLKRVETSSLHRGVAGARHSFLPAPPSSNKLDVLSQVCIMIPPTALHLLGQHSLFSLLPHPGKACSSKGCSSYRKALKAMASLLQPVSAVIQNPQERNGVGALAAT